MSVQKEMFADGLRRASSGAVVGGGGDRKVGAHQ